MDEVAFIVAADQAGFKYTWASEHHFLTDYSHLSANESFLAFAAAKTTNIHLGSGIFNITPPANHPARIAERVAMLDHLSEGRFEFGTGRGSSTTEQRGFGIEDPEITREMVAETLPQIVRMWKDEDYSYDGKFFSMPERNVLPKPYTNPHPPIWMAAGQPRRPSSWPPSRASACSASPSPRPRAYAPHREVQEGDRERRTRSVATSTTTS